MSIATAEFSGDLVYAVRLVAMYAASIIIVMAMFILLHYWSRRSTDPVTREKSFHVILATISYMLLVLGHVVDLSYHMVRRDPLSLRAPLALIGFGFGLWFLSRSLKIAYRDWKRRRDVDFADENR